MILRLSLINFFKQAGWVVMLKFYVLNILAMVRKITVFSCLVLIGLDSHSMITLDVNINERLYNLTQHFEGE